MDFKQIKGVKIPTEHTFLKSRESYLTGKGVLRTDKNHFWTVLDFKPHRAQIFLDKKFLEETIINN